MITFLSNMSRLATSTAFWVSFVVLVLSYLLLASYTTTIKQRSWVLTTLSSAVMSLISLPLAAQFAVGKGQLSCLSPPSLVTDSVARFFQAYLIADLTMGMLFYPSKVNILTGWIHHSVYVFIVEYAIQARLSHFFALFSVMEVPTFILAAGSLVPRLRSDIIFALSFFATRISLHIFLCVALVLQRNEVTNGSFGPAIITTCIFPLHAYWFTGCVKGLLKRGTEKSAPVAKPPANIVYPPERPITPNMSGPASLYASRASLARRRTALRMAVRARWDQFKSWRAGGQLSEVQRRVRAALPGRDRVYQYVGLESSEVVPSEHGLERVLQDPSPPALS